ncbi:MAG: N-acetyltransferase [Ruminococcaceae bacterium]|nr:N-acetyltransferase [Oscillospiraceae bacterium]
MNHPTDPYSAHRILLRRADLSDAPALVEIYRPYVEHTTVTLEYDVPTVEEFAGRIREFTADFPYLVCEVDGRIVGYAYAHRYKARFGYRFAAELSVYLDGNHRGKGLGRRLYGALIELLTHMGYKNLYGIVTDPNPPSFALHTAMGFREAGREHFAGCKFGQWRDVVLFERIIGEHEPCADESGWRSCPRRFDELGSAADEILRKYLE